MKKTERTCAGCGKHAPADDLVRVVHDPSSGEVAIDLAGSGFGRGAHLHGTAECIAKGIKSGLARVFKAKVVADPAAIGVEIVRAADRRIAGLLAGARRAQQLAIGSDSVSAALGVGKAELVVVARDAAAAAKLPEIQRAVASGDAIAFGDKLRLGALLGGSVEAPKEVAVIAILHAGVADAVGKTYRISAPFRSATADEKRSEEAWSSSSEVR